MQESTKRLIAYLKDLGVGIDKDLFEDRVHAQKLAYILPKCMGEGQLYPDFSFNIKGPYSHALTEEYYKHSQDFKECHSSYVITEKERTELERIRPTLSQLSLTDLEIVASLIFLKDVDHLDEDSAEKELVKRKPHLKIEDIWRCSNFMKILLLTDAERTRIMKSMKGELDGWEELSEESLNRFGG